jgi:hypothetical protein
MEDESRAYPQEMEERLAYLEKRLEEQRREFEEWRRSTEIQLRAQAAALATLNERVALIEKRAREWGISTWDEEPATLPKRPSPKPS